MSALDYPHESMVDADRRPTAQEMEELIDRVRRDPASQAFVDLGEAYLALGRPKDAIGTATVGLEATPDSLPGRVLLARAHAALHQWKEAQGELLRVVKVDRSNRVGFALLGEVLLRRADFERAVPVLQHAQNLDPTSPQILAMLRKARAGQPLDPPNPLPQPIPPRGETQAVRPAPSPTTPARPQARPGGLPVPTAGPGMPTLALGGVPMPAAARAVAPPPMSVEGVKPRLIANVKQQNAAAASLRQSAAVGENYLNDLLTGGLLDVAGVRVPDVEYDLRPDRRWGRSTRRMFVFLFIVLVFGIGGGGTWYWWSETQRAEAVAGLQGESRQTLARGDYASFVEGLKKLSEAIRKDPGNKTTFAYYVESAGLATLLFGEVRVPSPDDSTKELLIGADEVEAAYKTLVRGEDALQLTDEGMREMAIGKVALELSRMPVGSATPEVLKGGSERLATANKTLDELLAKNADDRWARWLKGRALLVAGDRKGALGAFKAAADGDGGLIAASIDRANMLVDDGRIDEALAIYKAVLDKSKGNPLARIGQALARSESPASVDKQVAGEQIEELNAMKTAALPSRVAAWRSLAVAIVSIDLDEYKGAAEALGAAVFGKPPGEPRFWSRVAWVYVRLGRPGKANDDKSDLARAEVARLNCLFFAAKAEPDPMMQTVDAAFMLAKGLPEKAHDLAAKVESPRARLVRIYALLDLNRFKEAQALAEESLRGSKQAGSSVCQSDDKDHLNLELRALCEQARMLNVDKERGAASDSLTKIASASHNQGARHALGVAYLALKDKPPIDATTRTSNLEYAKKYLTKAVDENTEEAPNPIVYRTRAALAEIALLENDTATAEKRLVEALDANSGFYPARALKAKLALRKDDPAEALSLLKPILSEQGAVTPVVLLNLAEALVRQKDAGEQEKEQAKALLGELRGKPGVSDEELARIAAMIDPKLPEQLGVPAPGDGAAPKDQPRPRRRRR
jgi:tetratricopeptide (TPR) repeat protein